MTKINNRPLFFCFLAFALGIYFARPIFCLNVYTCIFCFAFLFVFAFLCIKYKKIKTLILIFSAFCVGLGVFFISFFSFGAKSFENENYLISGRVCSCTTYENSESVILDSVYVNGEKQKHNFKVYIFKDNEMQVGDVIAFSATIKNVQLFELGKFNSYAYKYNVPYECSVSFDDVSISDTNNLSGPEKFRQLVFGVLQKNMSADEASVSYASLFGDKSYIEDDVRADFSTSGVAHLLAVSGLHVGFVALIIIWILKKIKVNNFVGFGILASFLGVYAYLCSFSASVLRASLMILIAELATLIGQRYEKLNALSIAGIVCLIINPLYVYDGGFLLSFACVLSIFMFSKRFERMFVKWHLPHCLASPLSVIVPVQLGILPILSNYFTKTSILTFFVNLLCVPIFEIFFILLFLTIPIVLLIPAFGWLLKLPQLIIYGIMFLAGKVANVKWAIINLTPFSGILIVGVYTVLFLFSHYVNFSWVIKTISCSVIIVVTLLISVISTLKIEPASNKITILNSYGNIVYCFEIDNESFAISNFDTNSINKLVRFAEYSRLYNIDNYISLNNIMPQDKNLFLNVYNANDEQEYNEVKLFKNTMLMPIKVGLQFAGVYIKTKDISAFIMNNVKLNPGLCMELALLVGDVDIIFGEKQYATNILEYIDCDYAIVDGNCIYQKNNTFKPPEMDFSFELKNNNVINMRGVN